MDLSGTPQKFLPAALSNALINRPRLESLLTKGLQTNARLITVTAPAGYGKSTLVSSWIVNNKIPFLWINLDAADDDPNRFLSTIQKALELDSGREELRDDPEAVIQAISKHYNQIKKSSVLVFDSLESIKSEETQNLLFTLITKLPLNVCTLLLSRRIPGIPISRMRAHNQLIEINESDLRFNSKEMQSFLDINNLDGIDPRNLGILTQKTQGWPAGVQLALELLGDQLKIEKSLAVDNLNGSHRYFSDYFNEVIFSGLNEDAKTVLKDICVFDRFSAQLCRNILSIPNPEDKLDQLLENQLFIQSIEGQPGWYSLHPLFQDFLKAGIDGKSRDHAFQKAAKWFYQQGEIQVAVDYGLRSGDEETVLRIIEPACEKIILQGDIDTISVWIDKWRSSGFSSRSELLAYQGWVKAFQGDFVQAQISAENAREVLTQQSKTKDKHVLQKLQTTKGKLAALQAFIAVMYTHRYDAAGKLAKEALKSLPKTYNAWILMALWSQAETQKRTDHINKAIDTLYEAIRIGNSLEVNIFQYAIVNSQAAALHFSGRRKEALAVCQKAISRSSDASDPRLGGLYAWLGRLHNEANQIDKAFANIQKGILLNEKSGVSLNLIFCRYYASQIYQAAGQKEKALEEIHYAQQLAGNASLSDENWLNAWEANLNLMQGNELQVEHWIRKEGPTLEQRPDYLNIESLIVHCRYLIHKGDLNHATKRLQTIEKYVRKRGYHRWLLTINLLQAIAWERKDKHQQALTFVKRALSIAAPEEYQRAFLDEDKLILKLVQELAVESPAFIMRLLRSASSQEKNNNKIPASILPDPLSEREIQVLELLTDGKKGPQIAKELFISYSTVRTHLKSIHRKLDVHSRQELLEKVRLLELI